MIELPWPPSINSCYRAFNGRSILSKVGRNYKMDNANLMKGQPLIRFAETDRLRLVIDLYPPTNHKIDIDNRVKILGDLLEEIGVIPNDNQVDQLIVTRKEVLPPGKAICEISVIKDKEVADAPKVQPLVIPDPGETIRERICGMLGQGMKQKEIAKALGITPSAVCQQVRRIRSG